MIIQHRKRFQRLLLTFALTAAALSAPYGYCQKISAEKEKELIALLRSDAPEADKALACKKLAIDGSAACVPELAALLKNEHLASWARTALEVIPDKAVDEALIKATYTLQGRLLVGVINSIGVRRVASAADSLKSKLLDKDVEVASAAAVSLGKIGTKNASQFLEEILSNSSADVRPYVAQGLVLCADRMLSDGNNAEAIKLYDKVRAANVSTQRTVEATRGAILARKSDGIPLLLEQLRSPEKAMFQVGLVVARELSGKAVDQALAAELTKAAPDRAALIIYAMADRKQTVELPAILAAAQAGPAVVRLAAIKALAQVGNASCLPSLMSVAGDSDAVLSQAAKVTLAAIDDDSVDKTILASLPSAKGKMVATLIDVIGIRQIQATELLVKSLSNEDKDVRKAALMALGNTVPLEQMNVLIEQVLAPKSDDMETSVLALKTAAVRMKDRDACASQLTTALDKASPSTKKTLVGILTSVAGKKALSVIHDLAKSNEADMKDAASKALGEWPTPDVAPVILELMKSGSLDNYRNRVFGGYLRVARQMVQDPERASMCKVAMEQARSVEEKERVVSVLQIGSIESLKYLVQLIEVPELSDKAKKAAIAISEKAGNRATEAKAILAKAGIQP